MQLREGKRSFYYLMSLISVIEKKVAQVEASDLLLTVCLHLNGSLHLE